VVLGLGLLVGSVWGRARFLILIGVVLVPTLIMTPIADFWQGQATQVTPSNFSDLQPTYSVDVGRLSVSLTSLPWDGEEIDLELNANVGEITLWVPSDVAVSGSASVDVGMVSVPGINSEWGFGSRTFQFDHPGWTDDGPARGQVRVVSSVDVGSIQIHQVHIERDSQ